MCECVRHPGPPGAAAVPGFWPTERGAEEEEEGGGGSCKTTHTQTITLHTQYTKHSLNKNKANHHIA